MAGKIDNFTPEEFERRMAENQPPRKQLPNWLVVSALAVLSLGSIALMIATVVYRG